MAKAPPTSSQAAAKPQASQRGAAPARSGKGKRPAPPAPAAPRTAAKPPSPRALPARNASPAARLSAERATAVRAAGAQLPTRLGDFRIVVYRDVPTGKEHAAIVKGDVQGKSGVLCRIHSECLTGDIFHSLRCDCGPQLQEALRLIEKEGSGVLLYLRQEGRDIGLTSKILAYELQEQGLDTVEANLQLGHPVDARTYDAARDMLDDLGVRSLRLLTNNPAKIEALRELGFTCVERIPLEIPPVEQNRSYLATKRSKMGHLLRKS